MRYCVRKSVYLAARVYMYNVGQALSKQGRVSGNSYAYCFSSKLATGKESQALGCLGCVCFSLRLADIG